jgi:hypothetical protein
MDSLTQHYADMQAQAALEPDFLQLDETEQVVAEPTPPVNYVDPRLKREGFRERLKADARDLVKGGGVDYVRNPDNENEIIERTASVNPQWFQTMALEEGVTVEQVQNAIDKAVEGKRLGSRQERIVRNMLDTYTMERTEQTGAEPSPLEEARAELMRRRDARREGQQTPPPFAIYEKLAETYTEEDYALVPEMDFEARAIYDLSVAVDEMGGNADAILSTTFSPEQTLDELQDEYERLSNAGTQRQRAEEAAPLDTEGQEAAPVDEVQQADTDAQVDLEALAAAVEQELQQQEASVRSVLDDDNTPSIFRNRSGNLFYTVSPSTKQAGKLQVTVWDENGAISDSQHDDIDGILRHYPGELVAPATEAEFDAMRNEASPPVSAMGRTTGAESPKDNITEDDNGYVVRPDGKRVRVRTAQKGSNFLPDVGSISYELRSGPDDRAPLDMVVSKEGKLVQRREAFNSDDSSSGVAWIPSSNEVSQQVQGLLKRRVFTELGSNERKAIDAKIAEIVKADQERQQVEIEEQPTAQDIDAAANEAATSPENNRPEPTDAQKSAGNYKKGEPFTLHGLNIVVENPRGSERKGRSDDGTEWSNTMGAHYGDIKRTDAADGDNLLGS